MRKILALACGLALIGLMLCQAPTAGGADGIAGDSPSTAGDETQTRDEDHPEGTPERSAGAPIAIDDAPQRTGLILEVALQTPASFLGKASEITVSIPRAEGQTTGSTDARGCATLDITELVRGAKRTPVLRLRFDHPDHLPCVGSAVIEEYQRRAAATETVTIEVVFSLVPATRRIPGVVRVPKGHDVRRVRVACVQRVGESHFALLHRMHADVDGRFTLRGLRELPMLVVAWLPGPRALRSHTVTIAPYEQVRGDLHIALDAGGIAEGLVVHRLPLDELEARLEFVMIVPPQQRRRSVDVGNRESETEHVLEEEFEEAPANRAVARTRWFTELEWHDDGFEYPAPSARLTKAGRFRASGLRPRARYRLRAVQLTREDQDLGACPLPVRGQDEPFSVPNHNLRFAIPGHVLLFRVTYEGNNRFPFHPVSLAPSGHRTGLDGAGQVVFPAPFGDRPGEVTLTVKGFSGVTMRAAPGRWHEIDLVRRRRR